MQVKLFTIPIALVCDYQDELNAFLRSHKIVEIEKQLVQTGAEAYWCLYISYVDQTPAEKGSKDKIDYMKVLEPEIFDKFSKLRSIRKGMSEKQKVSAFVIFTDAELAEIAKLPEMTMAALLKIEGIGKAKVEKYGAALIEQYNQLHHEAGRLPNTSNSKP